MTGDAQIGALMADLAAGRIPPVDAQVRVVPAPSTTHAAVLAFTGHHVIAADVPDRWIQQHVRHDPLTAPTSPAFLLELGRRAGHPAGTVDVVFTAPAVSTDLARLAVREVLPDSQPRVERARRYRRDVRVWQTLDEAGLVVIGRGLGGRWEASYEVTPEHRGRRLGRQLAATARTLIPPNDALFLQASPGNAASLRAAIGAGYTVVGAEVLFGGRVGQDLG
ncbi:MAG TPA: GNAT family N-acetyltransferase [Actinomycetes bacterium]|nr:GNAT family N-acetyltransferase [Actinomycetes bacterium]